MAITLSETATSQKTVWFEASNGKGSTKVIKAILNNEGSHTWELTVRDQYNKRLQLSVADLISMCDQLYSTGVLEERDAIKILFDSEKPTFIRGQNRIIKALTEGVMIEIP